MRYFFEDHLIPKCLPSEILTRSGISQNRKWRERFMTCGNLCSHECASDGCAGDHFTDHGLREKWCLECQDFLEEYPKAKTEKWSFTMLLGFHITRRKLKMAFTERSFLADLPKADAWVGGTIPIPFGPAGPGFFGSE